MARRPSSRLNLTQLKLQARELRKAHRSGSAEASARLRMYLTSLSHAKEEEVRNYGLSLTKAQFVIARENGLESWPRLKHHIETTATLPEDRVAIKSTSVKLTGRFLIDSMRALKADQTELAVRLIEEEIQRQGGAEFLFREDKHGGSPFAVLAGRGGREVLEALRPHGIRWTAWSAAAWGALDELRRIVAADRKVLSEPRGHGSPIHWAFRNGRMPVLEWLVESFGLDAEEGQGYVRNATFGGNDETIRFAVAHGADVDFDGPGQTALQHQCKHGRTTCVETLLSLGADPNRPQRSDGRTALHLAASTGIGARLIRLLLDAGADPNARDMNDATPLDLALKAKRQTAANTLIMMGVESNTGPNG